MADRHALTVVGAWNSMLALDVLAGFAQNDVAGSIGDCIGQSRKKRKISCSCVSAHTVGRPSRFTEKMIESTAAGNTTGSIFMGVVLIKSRVEQSAIFQLLRRFLTCFSAQVERLLSKRKGGAGSET